MKRVLSWNEAAELVESRRKAGAVIVTTNGCFDILHKGHVSYLEEARSQGDVLIVGLNTDSSVRRLGKGPGRPVNDELARAAVVGALRSVDAVCLFDDDTPVEWLRRIRPDIHVKGGDYDPAKMVETPALKEWGGRVHVVPFVPGYSTTAILEKSKK